MVIQHLLLDADGVIQFIPGGLHTGLLHLMGKDSQPFVEAPWHSTPGFVTGNADYSTALASALKDLNLTHSMDEIYSLMWERIQPVAKALDLVSMLRTAGYGVHLGTNQERRRAHYMRSVLGYDDVFDVSFYSCDLGVAKPDDRFFIKVLDRLGASAASVLFVDDLPVNVEAARRVGLRAESWQHLEGLDALVAILRRHGLVLRSAVPRFAEPDHEPALASNGYRLTEAPIGQIASR